MPDFASRSEAVTSWVLLPMEETIPMPVTTTRRMLELPIFLFLRCPVALGSKAALPQASPGWNRPTFKSLAV